MGEEGKVDNEEHRLIDIEVLMQDLALLRPSIFLTFPAIYALLYQTMQQKLKDSPGCTYYFIDKCVTSKLTSLEKDGSTTHMLLDKMMFNQIRNILGGKVRLAFSGGVGTLSSEILKFLKISFCSEIIEVYGLQESCTFSLMTNPAEPASNIVGGPIQNVKMKIKLESGDVDLLTAGQPLRGEVCLFGPTIMPGYFKQPDRSTEVLQNGWLHTGDFGEIMENFSLKITDKIRNMIQLSTGDQIAPQFLENIYLQSEYVEQIWVYGD